MSTTITPRRASVIIYQGDDMYRLGVLRRALSVAEMKRSEVLADPTSVLGDSVDVETPQAEYDAFLAAAAERAVEVDLTAIRGKTFRTMRAEHPARKVTEDGKSTDHPDDAPYGVNSDTMATPLLLESITAPTFTTSEAKAEFIESLSDGDHEKLFSTAFFLNALPSTDPKDETL